MAGEKLQVGRASRRRTFGDRLRDDLKDPEFRQHFEEEKRALALAMKIAEAREKAALTQRELADRVGSSQQAISRLESGEYEGYTVRTLERIADATGYALRIDFAPRKAIKIANKKRDPSSS